MGTEKCQKRVLVVEDNELNRKIAAQVIEDEGILTECAIDGLEAVKKVREAPEHYFDLILMDVQMPGLNGYQAAEQIRGLGRCDTSAVPILAMTAYTFPEDLKRAWSWASAVSLSSKWQSLVHTSLMLNSLAILMSSLLARCCNS